MRKMVDFRYGATSWDVSRKCLDPLVQVYEDEDEVVVTADLPCVEKEDIEVDVGKKVIEIKAKMKRSFRFERWGGIHRKVNFNSFRKSMRLPVEVIPEQSEAEFKNGVLKVKLKKRKGKKIEIK